MHIATHSLRMILQWNGPTYYFHCLISKMQFHFANNKKQIILFSAKNSIQFGLNGIQWTLKMCPMSDLCISVCCVCVCMSSVGCIDGWRANEPVVWVELMLTHRLFRVYLICVSHFDAHSTICYRGIDRRRGRGSHLPMRTRHRCLFVRWPTQCVSSSFIKFNCDYIMPTAPRFGGKQYVSSCLSTSHKQL